MTTTVFQSGAFQSSAFSSAQPARTGSASQTLGNFTQTATAQARVTGTASGTIAAFTQSASGTVRVTATATGTLASFTQSATGTVRVVASSTATLANFTQSAAAAVRVTGSSSITLANLSATVSGTVPVSAASTSTIADLTQTAIGSVVVSASSTSTIPDLTQSVAGTVTIVGQSVSTIEPFSLLAIGALVPEPWTPADLDNPPIGWWSPDDASKITLTSGRVEIVEPMIGSTNLVQFAASEMRPLLSANAFGTGLAGFEFLNATANEGLPQKLQANGTFNQSTYTVFGLVQISEVLNAQRIFALGDGSNLDFATETSAALLTYRQASGSVVAARYSVGGEEAGQVVTPGVPFSFKAVVKPNATGVGVNGAPATTYATGQSGPLAAIQFAVGGSTTNAFQESLKGFIGNVVLLNYEPSQAIEDRLHGWLLWSIDRADLLPDDHPYRYSAPVSGVVEDPVITITANQTFGNFTQSATLNLRPTAASSTTIGPVVSDASGVVIVTATAPNVIGPFTLSATGTLGGTNKSGLLEDSAQTGSSLVPSVLYLGAVTSAATSSQVLKGMVPISGALTDAGTSSESLTLYRLVRAQNFDSASSGDSLIGGAIRGGVVSDPVLSSGALVARLTARASMTDAVLSAEVMTARVSFVGSLLDQVTSGEDIDFTALWEFDEAEPASWQPVPDPSSGWQTAPQASSSWAGVVSGSSPWASVETDDQTWTPFN